MGLEILVILGIIILVLLVMWLTGAINLYALIALALAFAVIFYMVDSGILSGRPVRQAAQSVERAAQNVNEKVDEATDNQSEADTDNTSDGENSPPPGICGHKDGNEFGNATTLVVEDGHLLNVEWYDTSWTDHVRSVLPPGTYHPKDGIVIGAWWNYEGCTQDYVMGQAGSNYDWTHGFTKE